MQQDQKIFAMREGGHKLAHVRDRLVEFTQVGMSFAQIEKEARRLIHESGATPNFALVPDYHWATCIMRNDEMCHGIPSETKKVVEGDLLKIDVGLLNRGFNLDTTVSFIVGEAPQATKDFLFTAQKALAKAIQTAASGSTIFDISFAMQKEVERHGYSMVYQLTGHGIGKELHEEPYVPCIAQRRDKRLKLYVGQTLAIEVMCAMGKADLNVDADGWTYRTADGSLAAMIEETVLVTNNGPEVLT